MSSFGKGNAKFSYPNDIAQDRAGNLYVTDTLNHRVQVFDYKGQFLLIFSGRGASKKLRYPRGICVGPDDFVYVCDNENKCVSVFKTSGGFITSFGQFKSPRGIVVDVDGFVYIAEHIPEGRIDIF